MVVMMMMVVVIVAGHPPSTKIYVTIRQVPVTRMVMMVVIMTLVTKLQRELDFLKTRRVFGIRDLQPLHRIRDWFQ